MLRFKLRPYTANGAMERGGPTVSDRFARVLAHLNFEYDLPPDVWAAAEDVLQALKAGERQWAPKQPERSAWRF
jgi:hypothetical protein